MAYTRAIFEFVFMARWLYTWFFPGRPKKKREGLLSFFPKVHLGTVALNFALCRPPPCLGTSSCCSSVNGFYFCVLCIIVYVYCVLLIMISSQPSVATHH